MRTAIIDLGTNTCNLLIADVCSTDFEIIHQSKQLVKLGDEKIKTNEISSEAVQRILNAFQAHAGIIQKYKVDDKRVIATSAIRSAINKEQLLKRISNEIKWSVEVISGEREAELIFNGVLLAMNNLEEPSVILDIGGGSNELIIGKGMQMLWKESKSTGIGRVINRFQLSDPITDEEINELHHFFDTEHKAGFDKCKETKVRNLIGCSGAFDTIADIIDQVNPGEKQRITQNIALEDFNRVFENLVKSTRNQRLKMKGMDIVRVDLIVPAVILIEHLISTSGIDRITQTDYALREGVLFEMMEQQNFKDESKHQQSKKSS